MRVRVLSVAPAIDKNGAQRTFSVEDRQTHESVTKYPWEVELAIVRENAKYQESILAEYCNDEPKQPFADVAGTEEVVDANISFTVRQWEGKKFNNIRLYGISTKLQ